MSFNDFCVKKCQQPSYTVHYCRSNIRPIIDRRINKKDIFTETEINMMIYFVNENIHNHGINDLQNIKNDVKRMIECSPFTLNILLSLVENVNLFNHLYSTNEHI